MWFKNLQVYRLPAPSAINPAQLEMDLAPHAFQECSSLEMKSQGWASPSDNGELVYTINQQMLLMLGSEKKLLPTSVLNQVAKATAAEITEQQDQRSVV